MLSDSIKPIKSILTACFFSLLALFLLIGVFDRSVSILISAEKIESIQRAEAEDIYTVSYELENISAKHAYHVLVYAELYVYVPTMRGVTKYWGKHTEAQSLAASENAVDLKAREKRRFSMTLNLSDKEYAKGVGAVSAPRLRISLKKVTKD